MISKGYDTRKNNNLFLQKITIVLLYGLIISSALDGWIIDSFGFDRFITGYYILLLLMILLSSLYYYIHPLLVIYFLLVLSFILMGVALNGGDEQRLFNDVRSFMRSVTLGIFTFYFICTLKNSSEHFVYYFFKLHWFGVTLFVLLDFFLGIGSGNTHGAYSYFREVNSLCFLYIISWFYLITSKCERKKTVYTILTIIVSLLLTSKALTILVPGLLVFYLYSKFSEKSFLKSVFVNVNLAVLMTLFVFFFSEFLTLLFWFVSNFSADGDELLYWLEKVDILTVLTSTRNLRVEMLLNTVVENWSLLEIFFGKGMLYAISSGYLVESDPFDIFIAFGIFGFFLLWLPVLVMLFVLKRRKWKRSNGADKHLFLLGSTYALIFMSCMTGHVLISPMTMITLGVLVAMIANLKLSNSSDPRHNFGEYYGRHNY